MLSKRGQVRTNDLFIGFLTLSLPPPIPTHPRTRSRPETARFCNNTCPYGSLLANMGRGLSRYSGASDAPDFGHRTPAFVAPFSSPSPVGPYLQGPQGRSGNCPACACIKRRTAGSVPKLCGGRTVTEQGPVRHAGHHTCYGRALLPCGVRCTRTSPPSPPPRPAVRIALALWSVAESFCLRRVTGLKACLPRPGPAHGRWRCFWKALDPEADIYKKPYIRAIGSANR